MKNIPNDTTALRLTLLRNGYSPIRNRDKRTFLTGWPGMVITPELIHSWTRQTRDRATGLRVENGLAVIDIDINDEAAVTAIANRIFDIVPELADENTPLLVRKGNGFKEAWFVRTSELFSRLHSRAWRRPSEDQDGGGHRIEIFGGGSPRQFGAFGPHTVTDDGAVEVVYQWVDRSPADTRKSELPELSKRQLSAIVDAVEEELEKLGWTIVPKSVKGESESQRVYDLAETARFDLITGYTATLDELREQLVVGEEEGLRCSASFWEGPIAVNTTRCLISKTHSGHVAIWDSATGITHVESAAAPHDYNADIDRLGKKLRELEARERNKLNCKDGAVLTAAKLLNTYAFCRNSAAGVVPIYTTSMDDGIFLSAMRTELLPYCDTEIGPRGGVTKINPLDLWASSPKRVSVRGLRMRPDMPRPIYEEGGEKWINIYTPPIHDATGGSAEMGIEFLEYLIPDAGERRWFTQWLAHKVRYPHIPGPAVVMVAREQGTGRGTLGEIVTKLLGRQYVKQLPFHMFAGKSYQAQYDDWGASSLMVLVSESAETNGMSTYSTKRDTYEHLKEKVEPKPVDRVYVSKGTKAFTARHFTSYLIATNNVDALPIPAEDRRFGVVANGEPNRDPAFWEKVNAWIANDANIAAFALWLAAYDMTGYSPFVAPQMTAAKAAMVEMAGSDLDHGLTRVLESMPGKCFTLAQIIDRMRLAATEYDLSYPPQWQETARRVALKQVYRVGVKDGTNWIPLIDGKRAAVYARTLQDVRAWSEHGMLREEVLKNGTAGAKSLSSSLLKLVTKTPEV